MEFCPVFTMCFFFIASSASDLTAPPTPHLGKNSRVSESPNPEADTAVIEDEKKSKKNKPKRESVANLYR